jgi:hypothetical protein
MRRVPLQALSVAAILVATTSTAFAQTDPNARPQQSPAPTDSRRWEIAVHGGLSGATISSEGDRSLPLPAAPMPTSSPTFSTRPVPSWMFADGAAILNDVNALFGVPARVAPLDAALEALNLDYGTRTTIGVRVRRDVTARYAAELSIDVLTGSAGIDEALLSAVGQTRDSFRAAMAALLAEGPFTGVVVDANSATIDGSNREIAITGAASIRFGGGAGFVPYATVGAGVLTGTGDLPSITLEGAYRFRILDEVPIEEADRVTIRYENQPALIAVLGGGVRRHLGAGWGLHADGRMFIGPQRARLLIDASPSVARSTPADSIETVTNPSIQFSNEPSLGRLSTLSGSLDGFTAFSSSGIQTRVLITFGMFVTF